MEESKTLVEQLREMVELSIESDQYPTVHADPIIGHLCISRSDMRELFTTIADRIEREYLPRPRFEDGEPVKVGDTIDGYDQHGAKVEAITDWGGVIVRSTSKGGSGYPEDAYPLLMWDIKDCKRHMPEVLDADGVPIHKGDTVWYEGERYRVIDAYMLDGEDSGVDLESFSTVMGEPTKTITNAWNELVTHKQPDTLERIEADAMKAFNDYWGCGHAECSCCPVMVDGKKPYERYECNTSCLIAQRLDLLRRQREVLERGQE